MRVLMIDENAHRVAMRLLFCEIRLRVRKVRLHTHAYGCLNVAHRTARGCSRTGRSACADGGVLGETVRLPRASRRHRRGNLALDMVASRLSLRRSKAR